MSKLSPHPTPPASLSSLPPGAPYRDPHFGRHSSGHEPYLYGTVHVAPGGPPRQRLGRTPAIIGTTISKSERSSRLSRRTIRTA